MASKRPTKIDAVLRHLAAGGEIQDFPGTKFENMALARSIERRGLVLWDKEGNRHVLTPAGWAQLTPRRFGLPTMVVSTAAGAAIGAAVLAFLWLPGLEGRDSAYGHATASLEKPVASLAASPVDASGRSLARVPASATVPAAPAAATPAVVSEPVQAAADPAAEQPAAEPAPTAVKQAQKSHHRSARHEHYGNWRSQRYYADPRYDLGSPRYTYR